MFSNPNFSEQQRQYRQTQACLSKELLHTPGESLKGAIPMSNQKQVKQKHTPEPWGLAGRYEPESEIVGSDGYEVAEVAEMAISPSWQAENPDVHWGCYEGESFVERSDDEVAANAARIVACVNALAGLNPEAVRDVVEALKTARRRFSEQNGVVSAEVWNGNYKAVAAINAALARVKGGAS